MPYAGDILLVAAKRRYPEKIGFGKKFGVAECGIQRDIEVLRRDEMLLLLNKQLNACVPDSRRDFVRQLIFNEMYHYIEPYHGQLIVDRLWDLGADVFPILFLLNRFYPP